MRVFGKSYFSSVDEGCVAVPPVSGLGLGFRVSGLGLGFKVSGLGFGFGV